jgi:hypothetical protein
VKSDFHPPETFRLPMRGRLPLSVLACRASIGNARGTESLRTPRWREQDRYTPIAQPKAGNKRARKPLFAPHRLMT